MTNHNSLADLIKKLRRVKITSRWLPKLKFSHLYLKPYTRNKKEVAWLAGILEKRIANVAILERLRDRLVNEDIPNSNHLAAYSMTLDQVYSRYAASEPGDPGQFKRILALLKPLIEVVNANRQQELELLKKLERMLSGHPGAEKLPPFYSENAGWLVDLREKYSDILQRNHDAFQDILKEGRNDEQGIRLASRVQEDLSKLNALIAQNIFDSRATKRELVRWQEKLAGLEKQEQLN